MIYELKKSVDKLKALQYLNKLIESEANIELKKKAKRSLNQNNYLYLILSYYAIEYGASVEFIKLEYFKKLVNSEIFCFQKKVVTGIFIEEVKSTSVLDSVEMTKAIERFRNWSVSDDGGNIYLPTPNEDKFLNEIDIMIKKSYY